MGCGLWQTERCPGNPGANREREMSISAKLLACAALMACAVPVWGSFILLDDFNRYNEANPTDMGPNWSEKTPDFLIDPANTARTTTNSLMIWQGATGGLDSLNDWVAVTAINNGDGAPEYVGLVLRYADGSNHISVRLQDNDADNQFDSLFFYRNNVPWAGMTGGLFYQPITAVADVQVRAMVSADPVNPGMLQVTVELSDGLGGWPISYTRGNLDPTGLGSGIGLAGTGAAQMDDFGGFAAPEPATLTFLALGGLFIYKARRRMR